MMEPAKVVESPPNDHNDHLETVELEENSKPTMVTTTTTTTTTQTDTSTTTNNVTLTINKFNIINLLSYVLNVVVTFAIGTFGVGGRPTNATLSAKYQTLVTPAGTAFSIWGLIFIVQAIWVIQQLFVPKLRNHPGVYIVGYTYLIVCLFQAGWTLSFSYEIIWLSLVCMYGILVGLVYTTLQLQRSSSTATATATKHQFNKTLLPGYILWQFPFSIHCGWIIAASAVNTNVVPVFYNASSSVQLGIAYTTLAVLVLVGLSWIQPNVYPVDFTPPLVLIWALSFVYVQLQSPNDLIQSTFTQSQIDTVQYVVLAGVGIIGLAVIVKTVYVLIVQRPAAIKEAKRVATSTVAITATTPNEKNINDKDDNKDTDEEMGGSGSD